MEWVKGTLRQPLTHSSGWTHHCALSRKGRGHERREPRVWQESGCALMLRDAAQARLLSMRAGEGGAGLGRSQQVLLGGRPRESGDPWSSAVIMGPGSPLADARSAGTTLLHTSKPPPAGVETWRRRGLPVSGLFFTGSCATRACTAISFSSPPAVSSPAACTPCPQASCRRDR